MHWSLPLLSRQILKQFQESRSLSFFFSIWMDLQTPPAIRLETYKATCVAHATEREEQVAYWLIHHELIGSDAGTFPSFSRCKTQSIIVTRRSQCSKQILGV
jgi:hypothetical protein